MAKKIKAHLDFDSFDICKSPNDLMFYVRGYFDKLAFDYRHMTISEIKSNLEDLKIFFVAKEICNRQNFDSFAIVERIDTIEEVKK